MWISAGLGRLQHLTLGGVESIVVNPTFHLVVRRLATLDLEVRTPIAEVQSAYVCCMSILAIQLLVLDEFHLLAKCAACHCKALILIQF